MPSKDKNSKDPADFLLVLKQALEHAYEEGWDNPPDQPLNERQKTRLSAAQQWLGEHSPLTAAYFLGAMLAAFPATPAERGAALQQCLWAARDTLPEAAQLLLNASYFRYESASRLPPKREVVAGRLGYSPAKYFRHLDKAIEALANAFLVLLPPALGAESLYHPWHIGREAVLAQAWAYLKAAQNLTLLGPSGIGKTTLGMALAQQWQPAPVLWYTLQPDLNDTLEALIFALGHFLQAHGVSSGLWRQLVADRQKNAAFNEAAHLELLRSLLRKDLDQLPQPVLLGLDDAHTWQTEKAAHQQALAFVEGVAHTNLVVLALCHQRPLWAKGEHLTLTGLPPAELRTWPGLEALAEEDLRELHTVTAGHPALVRLVLALHAVGEPLATALRLLRAHPAAETLLERLWSRHLTPAERGVLQELAVFRRPVPLTPWQEVKDVVENLLQRALVQQLRPDELSLRPDVRDFVLKKTSAETRPALHLQAAEIRQQYGREYTAAMYHAIAAGYPALAVHWWDAYQRAETERGQAPQARQLLYAIAPEALPEEDDRRTLAILKAQQAEKTAAAQAGLTALHEVAWPPNHPLTPFAYQLEGRLLVAQGQIEQALRTFQAALHATDQLPERRRAYLHFERANIFLQHQPDFAAAAQALTLARMELETMDGRLAESEGRYDAAQKHYTAALELVVKIPDSAVEQARTHGHLADVAGYLHQFQPAAEHRQTSIALFEAAGYERHAMETRSNWAMALILQGRYAEAVAQAQTALRYFVGVDDYWAACNASNAGEACLPLGRYDEAELFALQSLRTETERFRPYALTTLGRVAQARQQFEQADQHQAAAIEQAKAIKDQWAEGYAWRARGENACQAGLLAKAADFFARAIAIFERLNLPEEVALTQQAQAKCQGG